VADLKLDRVERKVQRAGRKIELTAKEFALLEYLMRNAGRRITRSMIIEHVWNLNFDTSTNVVDVYINYLRKKLDEDASCRLIHTIRGVGYELSDSRRGRGRMNPQREFMSETFHLLAQPITALRATVELGLSKEANDARADAADLGGLPGPARSPHAGSGRLPRDRQP
jgi:DNA-binding winged helix-turn-helix (wHTH) protein